MPYTITVSDPEDGTIDCARVKLTNARSTARVLTTLDESTYSGGGMGADHPHTWCKSVQGGRSFYTGSGHTQGSYAEPAFRSMVLGGIR